MRYAPNSLYLLPAAIDNHHGHRSHYSLVERWCSSEVPLDVFVVEIPCGLRYDIFFDNGDNRQGSGALFLAIAAGTAMSWMIGQGTTKRQEIEIRHSGSVASVTVVKLLLWPANMIGVDGGAAHFRTPINLVP